MWSTIDTAAGTILQLLPELTITLKFCTALIGLVITFPVLIRRVRRWQHRRR